STSQTMVPSNSPETMVPSGESMPDALPPVIVQPVAVPKAKVEPASDTSNEPSASSVPVAVRAPNGSKVMVKVSSSKSSNSIVISPALMASDMTSLFSLQPRLPRPPNCNEPRNSRGRGPGGLAEPEGSFAGEVWAWAGNVTESTTGADHAAGKVTASRCRTERRSEVVIVTVLLGHSFGTPAYKRPASCLSTSVHP